MLNKSPKVLYFIHGAVPSEKELADAKLYGNNVAYRNAQFATSGAAPEPCDGVAGAVPEAYASCPKAALVAAVVAEEKEELPHAEVVPPAAPPAPPQPPVAPQLAWPLPPVVQ